MPQERYNLVEANNASLQSSTTLLHRDFLHPEVAMGSFSEVADDTQLQFIQES